ncbi:hypothetical protein E2K93_14295 [Thalassotalea sp. HSM 43]|uniref:hypothetical protein n=1 Tax=Thalassotalea sp. HSM 43 TaxID=2552945 RepID=UPI00108039C7|nr:hypothetical protein [Thalassotalea sp. HSM 43]QBY05468.1 hypothetical protein E2K93_14295 [Thalassotalea sp. HSM 43]
MGKNKNVNAQYIEKYAETETAHLDKLSLPNCVDSALVIPAYREGAEFIQRFIQSPFHQTGKLLIVVINQPDNDFDKAPQQALYDEALALGQVVDKQHNLTLITLPSTQSMLLIVDRFNTPIPHKQGVGLARKIGCDLAASLYNRQLIGNRFICSSDADAHLPDNYFSHSTSVDAATVCIGLNFQHHCQDELINNANALYEKALRYYVAGLTYAKSDYAFFTIGSVLAFDVNAYCQCRGFPKRAAGEDFYLLNKLVKLGRYQYFADIVINLEARTSSRVPFGTGPAVAEIIAKQQNAYNYPYYNPQLFVELKALLTAFGNLYEHRLQLQCWTHQLSSISTHGLTAIGFDRFIRSQAQTSKQQFNKQLCSFFDAFKTLKYLHALREQGLSDIALHQAITTAPFPLERQ